MNLRERIKKDIGVALNKFTVHGSRFTDDIEVFRPENFEHGDYSTNVALKMAGQKHLRGVSKTKAKHHLGGEKRTGFNHSTMEFAHKLADRLKNQAYIEKLEVKSPGFINFFVKKETWQEEVSSVLKIGEKFGSNALGKGKKARVEFVSANPTGPLHFGNARGGPIGDVLASVLEFSGFYVLREHYHNDIGGQVEKLGESIVNIERGGNLADQEYKGEYVRELIDKIGKVKTAKEAGEKAVEILLREILNDCEHMGIKFDAIYKESEFISSKKTEAVIENLTRKKALKKKDGATWFVPRLDSGQAAKFLEDRESVVIKSDGAFTYFANDIAYHHLKFKEKFDLVIDVLGANHHGHVPRLQAVIESLGYDTDKFKVILYQWVRFKRKGELVAMSKRSGTFVTAGEVLDEIGKDALRFFILMHDASSHIDFDLDLAREKSNKNPVYYVQYAHARIVSILEKSKVKSSPRLVGEAGQKLKVNYGLLTSDYELNLLKQISKLPELIEDIAQNFAVNALTTYSVELADSFHKFYENVQVLVEDRKIREARLALIMATKITLENSLKLLGVSAPNKM